MVVLVVSAVIAGAEKPDGFPLFYELAIVYSFRINSKPME
jgi:hypothetical protein